MKLLNLKKLIVITFFPAILFVINSCCTAKYCLGADDMNQIYFYGFNQEDLDTVVIKRFSRNNGFKNVMDSSKITFSGDPAGTGLKILQLTYNLYADFDYAIQLPGKTFTFSDFVVKNEKCNTGFLCNDSYNALKSYKVNGQAVQSSGILEIHQ